MQNLLGYTALEAGLALSPRGVGAFFADDRGRAVRRQGQQSRSDSRRLSSVLAYSSLLFGDINLSIGMSSIVWPVT